MYESTDLSGIKGIGPKPFSEWEGHPEQTHRTKLSDFAGDPEERAGPFAPGPEGSQGLRPGTLKGLKKRFV